jgi:hypothetical protein
MGFIFQGITIVPNHIRSWPISTPQDDRPHRVDSRGFRHAVMYAPNPNAQNPIVFNRSSTANNQQDFVQPTQQPAQATPVQNPAATSPLSLRFVYLFNERVLSEDFIQILDNVKSTRKGENRIHDFASALPETETSRKVIAAWYLEIMHLTKYPLDALRVALKGLGVQYEIKDARPTLRGRLLRVPGLPFTTDENVAPGINPYRSSNLNKKEKAAAEIKMSIKQAKDDLIKENPILVPGYALFV